MANPNAQQPQGRQADLMRHAPEAQAVASSAGATVSPGQPAADLEEVLIVPLPLFGMTRYLGTRAQLEADGLLPVGTVWPVKDKSTQWSDGRFDWRLFRTRRQNQRGPKSVWVDGDWWCLASTLKGSSNGWVGRAVVLQRQLDVALRNSTDAGQALARKELRRLWASQADQAYQAFRASIPALAPQAKTAGRTG